MLSVLIPIHNYKVVPLVKAIFQQCRKLKIEYEILCFDDFSKEEFKEHNRLLSSMFKINYMELSENLGRSRIRNWLAKSARYDNLLYLDCDSKMIKKDFIKTYIQELNKPYDIIHGGRRYQDKMPKAKAKKLHWQYGTKKESQPASKRNKHPGIYFHSNNFLIRKDLIRSHPFEESLQGYGYEDVVMAQKFLDKGFSIRNIDNPIRHLGIEKNTVFLNKTKEAVKNLIQFEKSGLVKNTRIQKFYTLLVKCHALNLVESYIDKNIQNIESNLLSDNPSLIKFSAFKFYYYLKEKR